MNKNFLIFIKKFKVPEKMRNHIHKILNDKEIIILNYLADREEKISNIAPKIPFLESSLVESLWEIYMDKEMIGGFIIAEVQSSRKAEKLLRFVKIFFDCQDGYKKAVCV